MNLIILGIQLLLILIGWNYFLKPALLDFFRDKLFDEREKLREEFLERENGLENPAYIVARNIINHHIRFLENISMTKVMAFQKELKKQPELMEYLKDRQKYELKGASQSDLRIFTKYRQKVSYYTRLYMVHSSFVGCFTTVSLTSLVVGCVFTIALGKKLFRVFQNATKLFDVAIWRSVDLFSFAAAFEKVKSLQAASTKNVEKVLDRNIIARNTIEFIPDRHAAA